MNETLSKAPAPAAAEPHPHHIARSKVVLVSLLIVVFLSAIGLAGYLPRKDRARAAEAAAHEEQTALPIVAAIIVHPAPQDTDLLLPGNVSAIAEASIFARATGYVRKRYVDIGDHVRTGQLMAEIETPDLDQQVAQVRSALSQARQQLAQTQAALVQVEAQRDLAKLTWERYNNLVGRGAIARQDADQQESAWKTSEALVTAQEASVHAAQDNVGQAQANLDRMTTLQDYQKVRAPFNGIVTARNIDVGYLISPTGAGQGAAPLDMPGAQSSAAASNEMFRVAQVGTLRIMVSVPQANAPGIVAGMPAQVLVAEFPGKVFTGKVTRTTNSLDPNSRTMLSQIDIPNADGKLLPGMYAQVRFQIHRDVPPLVVPGDSIMAGPAGTQVAVLEDLPQQNESQEKGATSIPFRGAGKRIHLQTVQIGRDYGSQTEIVSGLAGSEMVAVNPGDDVREGRIVMPELQKMALAGGARPSSQPAATAAGAVGK